MSAEFPSLADVVRAHRLVTYIDRRDSATEPYSYRCECLWESPEQYCTRTDHPEHVEQMWLEACTITSVEQLDALPELSIVGLRMDDGSLCAIEKDECWVAVASPFEVTRDQIAHGIAEFGAARLLWHPADWSTAK